MRRDKRIISIVFITVSIVALQCFLGTIAEGRRNTGKEKAFNRRKNSAAKEAEELFLKGDYRNVAKACDDILYLSRRYPSEKRYIDKLYYLAGISYLKLRNTSKAKDYLNKIMSDYKRSHLLADACLALAEVYYLEEDYNEAAELLIHYRKTYPTNPSIPQAYLRLGQIARKGGRWQEAKFYFDKIREDYPLSFEASFIPFLSDESGFFTVQLGSFNSLDNARKLKKKLEEKGYSPYIVEVRSSSSTFYRVRVGKVKSKTEAKHLADKLREIGFKTKVYP